MAGTIKVTDIIVEDRARDVKDVDSLAASIKDRGLLHPIVLDESLRLLAGNRRLVALITLGIVELREGLEYRVLEGEIDLGTRLRIELDENMERLKFDWSDELALRKRIMNLVVKLTSTNDDACDGEPKKSCVKKAAETLGISEKQLYSDIKVMNAVEENPLLLEEESKEIVISKIKKKEDTSRRLLDAKLSSSKSSDIKYRLLIGDAIDKMTELEDSSVDLMLVDPPFGVDLPNRVNWTKKYSDIYGGFSDTKDEALKLLAGVLIEAKRVLKRGRYCWVFFSTTNYREVEDIIQKTLGGYQKAPGYWIKTSNHNFKPFERQTVNYEPYFMCWNFSSQKSLQFPVSCANPFKGVQNKIHPAEKPLELYDFLIEASSVEGEVVLDPFGGSGASGESALRLKREVIVIENNPDYGEMIQNRLGGI